MPVLVITGQSGAGKGTLIERLLERFPQLALGVSATTRERRPGERDGVHYYFISPEEFDRRLADGEFLEYHVFPWGQRSGTLSSEIERIAADGRVCVLELETEGALAVADRVSEAVTIFITAPIDELELREPLQQALDQRPLAGSRLAGDDEDRHPPSGGRAQSAPCAAGRRARPPSSTG